MLINTPNINAGITEQQFQRTRSITNDTFKKFPSNCIILGLGGIGGHVADILSSIPSVNNIVLFDDDIVELSNLNRTVYQFRHIGQYKVSAMAEIISSRNLSSTIYPLNMKFDEDACKLINSSEDLDFIKFSGFMVFDCRDNFFDDYKLFDTIAENGAGQHKIIRAAYNKMSITIDLNPIAHPVWGSGGYDENTGSHSIPSRLVATLIVMCASDYNRISKTPLFNIPLTFDAVKIIDFIFKGTTIEKLELTERNKVLETLEKNIENEEGVKSRK